MDNKSGGAVIYFKNHSHEYYRIDLDCLSESRKLVPITKFGSSGWTVIDECIYSMEGVRWKDVGEQNFTYMVGEKLHKYNITSSSSDSWKCISPSRYLRWNKPFVFAFDKKKIYVVGGDKLSPQMYRCYEDTDWTCPGEYYDLDSGTWQCLNKPPKLEDIDEQVDFPSLSIARLMDDETKIIFYSDEIFLLYDAVNNVWKQHCSLEFGFMNGLDECHYDYQYRDSLYYVIPHTRPVVCHSTLYWFNNDLCLYGYDYIQEKWFQSNSLQEQLDWPHMEERHTTAFLFYVDNQTFVALSPIIGTKELALAIIAVKRDSDSGSLNVSLIFAQNFNVETSFFDINILDGMTIWKDKGSVLGKGEFALVD